MNKDIKIYFSLVIIVALIIIGIYYFKNMNQQAPEEAAMRCIASKAVLYSQTSCSHCIQQKQILGDYASLFTIIECDKDISKCTDIRATPTWIINNQKIEGTQTIQQLKELTGC